MKVVLNKKEHLELYTKKRVDLKGKATEHQIMWQLDKVDKNDEKSPYFEVNNDNFCALCEVLNISDKQIKNSLKKGYKESLIEYGEILMKQLKISKARIKIVNDTYIVVDKNQEVIFKTNKFTEIAKDLTYKNRARELSADIDLNF